MARSKNAFYVVWEGHNPGIYSSWEECKRQIEGFAGARFKGFQTREAAEWAFSISYAQYVRMNPANEALFQLTDDMPKPVYPSIAVDAAWNTATGDMEYRGVDTRTGRELFRQGPYFDATNNIGEFLAIVHGLALLKQQGSSLPIYTDSKTAMAWVRRKKANSKLEKTPRNAMVFSLIARAEKWLAENTWNNPILKWETAIWGEIPADFGRK